MKHHEERIRRLLETFFKATQIEALFFDRQLNLLSCRGLARAAEDLPRLSLGNVERFLSELFEEAPAPRNYYTYHLDQNLICNISLLYDGETCCGAAVTQPVSLGALKKADLAARLTGVAQSAAERDETLSALRRVPVISHERIRSMGEVLAALSRCVFEDNPWHQVFCGGRADPAAHRLFQSGRPLVRPAVSVFDRHNGYPAYLRVKEAISKGDAEAVTELSRSLDLGSVHPDQGSSKDAVRSIKNGLIGGLSMCCFIAVESGAPYNQTREITEGFTRELEDTENVADMYRLMHSALLAFARAVAVTRIVGYSRPVRLAIEYIETHYAEKITLKTLADQVQLSEFYLSALVKKETGSNIVDIINRVRIEESKKILLESPISISELAARVGYTYSNHFSRIFKQHTGMTPSGYIKLFAAASDEEAVSKDILRMLLDQLCHFLLQFPSIFDIVRIVDPHHSTAWHAQQPAASAEGTCYEFWSRNESCKNCISRMALEQDRPFIKLDQGAHDPFLVFAVPMAVGGKRYAIELLKCVSDNYFDCTREPVPV